MTVDQAAKTSCTTRTVERLSRQIIAEAIQVDPGLLVALKHARIKPKYEHVFLFLQPYAAESLYRVVNRRRSAVLVVASCLRVLPGQYLLYEWFSAKPKRCNIKLAAPPGSSNHERGNAVDVERPTDWKPHFQAEGWRWLGDRGDAPHFDKVSGRNDVDNRLIAAFQRLHNRHAGGNLKVDGDFGARTEAALKIAPANGWEGTDMADLDRINHVVNGTDQTERIKTYLQNDVNTLWDASDWCDYASYAKPTYDPKTRTLYTETAKVDLVDDQGAVPVPSAAQFATLPDWAQRRMRALELLLPEAP